jgi:hypothetical protein
VARPSHRPIRVKPARSCPASIPSIRMATDHARNSLSRSLRPRTPVTGRFTGGVLRLVADRVAPTQAEINLDRRAVRELSGKAAGPVERRIHHLVRRGPGPVPTAPEATRRT